ncbi:CENP-V/GFA domain-containing protein [Fusarium sp. LHS14.1]|nr:CENP-V/GFA domain-containing protein [Fusarium sp. LHS14.1]
MSGSCLCGDIKYTISGDPVAQALCHCLDCRRISGSLCSFNWVLPSQQLTVVNGTPKTYTNASNTGNAVTSHFCGNCGTTIWRDGPATQGMVYLKAGTIDNNDERVNARAPVAEIFTRRRIEWVHPMEGAQQKADLV